MAWTEITRPKYLRKGRPSTRGRVRYASDTSDAEWAEIEPQLPPPAKCGRTRETDLREVVNSIFYIAQTGCQWRLLPLPALHHGAAVFLCGARQRRVADHQSCAADGRPRSRRTRGKSDRRRDRQPIGQDDRIRWSARLCGREDDQGPQAAYPDRHHRPARRDDRASGERAG